MNKKFHILQSLPRLPRQDKQFLFVVMTRWFGVAPQDLFKKNMVMSLWLTEALTFNKTRTPGIFLIFVLGPVLQKLMDVLNFTQVNRLMKIN